MKAKQEDQYGLTKETLNEIFSYNDGNLSWKDTKHKRRIFAGWLDSTSGYLRVQIGSNTWLLHRLVWTLHNGQIPEDKTIDHIDHNKENNKIENLRLATRSEQNKYQRKRKNCATPYIGVYFRKRSGKYEVALNTYEHNIKKTIWLGEHDDPEVAAKTRDEYILNNGLHEFNLLNFPCGKAIRECDEHGNPLE